jgi:response regulator RpfG family c-di-GMP phosphodiesterase
MSEKLTFANERKTQEPEHLAPWKILIVDDDEEVHAITTLALRNFRFDNRPLTFLHSYSGAEGEATMRDNPDIALCLLDVVMETDQAGLDLAEIIRTRLNNTFTRIVLRTGQPGQAPEETIIADYDINDYKEKTELTRSKLHTLLFSCLRSYRDILALDRNRQGLERILSASIHLQQKTFLTDFARGILEQISAILSPDEDALYAQCEGIAAHEQSGNLTVVAGTGAYRDQVGVRVAQLLPGTVGDFIDNTDMGYHSLYQDNGYLCLYRSNELHLSMLFLKGLEPKSPIERHLLEVFCQNALSAFENLSLRTELAESQREIVYILGDAIEHRSRETGQHLRRVCEISQLIALKGGLNEQHAVLIGEAAPLHDLGKIGIPDHVLNKPGPLTPQEWEIMKTHSQIGYDLLQHSDRPILQAGALIALDHHERWDGSGYPQGKQGKSISIEGRITALADVFDALTSARCYKEPWSFEAVKSLFVDERGKHFDPELVDILLEHFDEVIGIKHCHPD